MNDSPSVERNTPGALRASPGATAGRSIESPTERYVKCLCGESALTVMGGTPWRSAPQADSAQAARAAQASARGRALTRPVLAAGLRSARLRPRVRLEVDLLQAPAREVGVELRGRHVGVTEHLLHRAEVAASGQQMGGEGVAQGMGAHAVRQPRALGVAADDLVEALAGQRPTPEIDEQVRLRGLAGHELGPAPPQIDPHRGQ